jgi:NAD(P)-dependent dehydrogenase (short-subunit alcohol dehydrogenase family)
MSAGGAIVNVSSNGGLGWSMRMPVLMELLQIDDYERSIQWCREHEDTVREGYALSKEAIIVWTMLCSSQLIKRGIRINCTMPGPTQTPMMSHFEAATKASVLDAAMQPINRRSTPEEQAGPLVFLNSEAASYINGVALSVDGGFMGGVVTGQIDITAMMSGD